MSGQVHRLRLDKGVQTVRIDEDSVDYRWDSADLNFHGTIPLENLRLKNRYSRKDRPNAATAAFAFLLLLALVYASTQAPQSWHLYFALPTASLLVLLIRLLTAQFQAKKVTYVQIEPRLFGFKDAFPIPDDQSGEAFLTELEAAWKESLTRRFLYGDFEHAASRLRCIDWLECIGVLSGAEAKTERSAVDPGTELHSTSIALPLN